jgi:hypothetical protein
MLRGSQKIGSRPAVLNAPMKPLTATCIERCGVASERTESLADIVIEACFRSAEAIDRGRVRRSAATADNEG